MWKVVKTSAVYAVGSPGWNRAIRIDDERGAEIAYASWPNVHGAVRIGWASLDAAKAAYAALPDGPADPKAVTLYLAPWMVRRMLR